MTKAAPITSAFSWRRSLTAATAVPPGGDQIVHQQDRLADAERVLVDLDDIDAIFELVVLTDGLGGQLALLADRHEAAMQTIRRSAAEDEPARLDTGDRLDPLIVERLDQFLDASLETRRMAEQRGDVAEHDAGFRIVRYGPHETLEINVLGRSHQGLSVRAGREGAG